MKHENYYMLMALICNVIFGFSFLFSKQALSIADPLMLVSVRFLIAFILMNLLWKLNIIHLNLKDKDIKPLLLIGLFQPFLYFVCESYGLLYTSSSFAGIIIALAPIAGVFMSALLLKEIPTFKQIIFSILSVFGVIILSVGDDLGNFSLIGLLFLIGSVFSSAMFNISSRKLADKFSAVERTYVMFGVSTVLFFIVAIIQNHDINAWISPLTNMTFWISIAYLAVCSSVGAFLLVNIALTGLSVTRTLVFANVSTIVSVLAGIAFLHESFTMIQGIGIIIVLLGVYGVNKYTQ